MYIFRYIIMKKKRKLNPEKLNPKNTLIVVIDLQNDFCHQKSIFNVERSKNRETAHRVYDFVAQAKQFGVDTVYTQQIFDESKLTPRLKHYYQNKKHACETGSFGAKYFEFEPPKDKLFTKYNFDIWQNKDFEKFLNKNKIDTLIITGVEIPVCVMFAVMGADERGFHVVMPKDLMSSVDSRYDESRKIINNLGGLYGPVVFSRQLLKIWNNKKPLV